MLAINVWIFAAATGFAVHGNAVGAAVWLAVASGITLAINLIAK